MSVDIEHNPYKADFPLLASHPHLAYLDSAATAQRPQCVLDAQAEFSKTMNANPLRGLYELSVKATAAIDATRAHIARYIGAGEDAARDIVFSRNTSEALNMLAASWGGAHVHEGDEVAVTIMEHHSNMVPWQQLCRRAGARIVYLYCDMDGHIPESELDKIGPATKVVAAAQVSNVLGVQNPVAELAARAHAVGAVMVVDGAQGIPHAHVDVKAMGCDFYAFSAHKMLGPFGIGVLWGKHELLEAMDPFLTGGEMVETVSEEGAVWSPVPEKFEAGTQDACGIYATDAALSYMEQVGIDAIATREAALARYLMDALAELDYIELIGPADPASHHGAISWNLRDIHPHDVSSIMAQDEVAIRAGHHCAQPLLTHLGVKSCCRSSVAFYNDKADIDRFVESVKGVWRIFHGE